MNKEEPTVKIVISVPESLLAAVDDTAIRLNVTRREIILIGIEVASRYYPGGIRKADLFVRKDSPPPPTGPDNEFVKW